MDLADLIPGSKVLILFDENFKHLQASKKIEPSGMGWRWHVVWETQIGIFDAEEAVKIGEEWLPTEKQKYFKENYPDSVYVSVPGQEEKIYIRPKKFTYVFFNVFDNPELLRLNPTYLSELQNLPDHERDTQLWGNWYSTPRGMSLWQRHWIRGENGEKVKLVTDIPEEIKWFRGWDKGYSEVSEVNKYPDFSAASCKIGKDSTGQYRMVGDFQPEVVDSQELEKDSKSRVYGRFRKLAGERDSLIIKQALYDGDDCTVVLTKDSGGAASDHMFTKARLKENNIKVVEDKSAKNTPNKKLVDFQPFAQACMIGLVYIVESTFNPATLKAIYLELENFDPDKKSNGSRKDDWVDSHSITFAAAMTERVLPSFTLGGGHPTQTRMSEVMSTSAPQFGNRLK